MRARDMYVRPIGATAALLLVVGMVAAIPTAAAASASAPRGHSTAKSGAPDRRSSITVGKLVRPDALRAGATGFAAASDATPATTDTLTFSELPLGVPVTTQYQRAGIIFGGDSPFITNDGSNPTSPVLSGTPLFQGAITGTFVQPDGSPRTVDTFSVDVGYIDDPGSTIVYALDSTGAVLENAPVNGFGIVRMTVSHPGIASFRVAIASVESNGFALDNLTFSGYPLTDGPTAGEQGGAPNGSEHPTTCVEGEPVNCATGTFYHQFTDLSVPGRGPQLVMARTYSSDRSGDAGPLGYGWTFGYAMSLQVADDGSVTVRQEDGSQVTFQPDGSGGYTAPSRVLASLTQQGDGTFVFTRFSDHQDHLFDASGRLTSIRDRAGYRVDLGYDGSGQLIAATDESGRSLDYAWGGDGHITSVTDPMGRVESYVYDGSGDLVTAIDPAGGTWTFDYDSAHLMVSMTDPRGHSTTNVFDGAARVVSQTDRAGLTSTWSYAGDPSSLAGGTTLFTDEHGNATLFAYSGLELVSTTHGYGTSAQATTSFSYDPATLGRTQVRLPDGTQNSNTYDAHGNQLSAMDGLGRTTVYTYDGLDQMTSRTTPGGATTLFDHDSDGNLSKLTDPTGGTTTFERSDAAHPGDITAVVDQNGNRRDLTHDVHGDVTSVTVHPQVGLDLSTSASFDADSEQVCSATPNAVATGVTCPDAGAPRAAGTTTTAYDDLGRATNVIGPLGGVTTYAYNANGDRISATDPDGRSAATTYDADDRPLTLTRGGQDTTHAYDLLPGNGGCDASVTGATYCTTVTNPNNHTTIDWYSARGDLLREQRPGGNTATHTYDLVGRETSRTDASGRTTTYGHDNAGELTSTTFSDGTTPPLSYGFDADGRVVTMTDGTGTTTSSFDASSRLLSRKDGSGAVVSYTYDAVGNETSITYPSGRTITRTFDGASRMTSLNDGSRDISFAYDADGRVIRTSYPNGDTVRSSYDLAGRLGSTSFGPTGGADLGALTLTHDAAGIVTAETDSGALNASHTFGYDGSGQLSAVDSTALAYDAAGNPTALPDRTQTFGAADQLTSASAQGTAVTYGYDALGERTSTTIGTDRTDYTFDQSGRLSAVSRPAARPVAAGLAPAAGPLAGGTTVTLTGTGFTGATAVRFGAAAATFTVVSDTQLQATSPPGTGTVAVTVTTPGGTSDTGAATSFTYQAAPTVKKINPNSGPTGTVVTVTGTGYDNVLAVQFGSVNATFTRSSSTALTATAPAGSGTVQVTVVTPGGTSATTNSTRFTYSGGGGTVPAVTAVTPASGPVAGGTSVTLTGSGFTGATSVHFGTASATFAVKSATSITATSPAGTGTVPVTVTTAAGTSNGTATFTYLVRPVVTGLSPTVGSTSGGTSVTITGTGLSGATSVLFGAKVATQVTPVSSTSLVATSPSSPVKTVDVTVVTAGGTSATSSADRFTYSKTAAAAVADSPAQQEAVAGASAPLPSGDVLVEGYAYDGAGLRTASIQPFGRQSFTWDVTTPVPQLLVDGGHEYVTGPDGAPVEQIDGANTPAFFVHDAVGSTRALLGPAGSVVGTLSYTVFGRVSASNGPVTTQVRFGGYYADDATGLYFAQARYYDPASGQFLSRDPIESLTGSAYGYADNDPVNASDPTGMFCWSASCLIKDVAIGAAAVAVVAAVVVLAPEVTVGAIVTVTVEEAAALAVTETGEIVAATAVTTTVEAEAITTATIAASVGQAATYVGFADAAANVMNRCSGGRTPECVSAIEELGTDFAFGAVGKLLDSPAYEFFNALREFENAVRGEEC